MMKRVYNGHSNGWILNNGGKAIEYPINVSGIIKLDEMLYKEINLNLFGC